MLKVIDARRIEIIYGTGTFSTPSAKLLGNRRFRSNYLDRAQGVSPLRDPETVALDEAA